MSAALPDIPSPPNLCAFVPDRLGLRLASGATSGSSYFAHCSQSRQSHLAVSSLCCGPCLVPQSTDYLFTSSCSPPHLAVTQLLSVSGVSSTREGLSPSCAPSLPSARARTFLSALASRAATLHNRY